MPPSHRKPSGPSTIRRSPARGPRPDRSGGLRLVHILVGLALLVLPALAIFQVLGTHALGNVGAWAVLASIATYIVYGIDKHRARKNEWRVPESWLHLLELIGGWPGAFLAQRHLRHKSAKGAFRFLFWLIVGLYQLVAADALLGWQMSHALVRAVRGL